MKFSRDNPYGQKKSEQRAIKDIVRNKNIDKKRSIDREIKKNYDKTIEKISPTGRMNNTFGNKKIIK
jgi:hypothetical protein